MTPHVSLAFSGVGVGSIILLPWGGTLIGRDGWRAACWAHEERSPSGSSPSSSGPRWDADGTLFPLWRSGQPLANFYNADFDGLLDQAKVNMDPKARLDLYAKALRIFMEEAPAIPLYQQMDLYGVNKRVTFKALSSEQIVGVWLSLKDQK